MFALENAQKAQSNAQILGAHGNRQYSQHRKQEISRWAYYSGIVNILEKRIFPSDRLNSGSIDNQMNAAFPTI